MIRRIIRCFAIDVEQGYRWHTIGGAREMSKAWGWLKLGPVAFTWGRGIESGMTWLEACALNHRPFARLRWRTCLKVSTVTIRGWRVRITRSLVRWSYRRWKHRKYGFPPVSLRPQRVYDAAMDLWRETIYMGPVEAWRLDQTQTLPDRSELQRSYNRLRSQVADRVQDPKRLRWVTIPADHMT